MGSTSFAGLFFKAYLGSSMRPKDQMFQRKRGKGLKQALEQAGDFELRALREELAQWQDRVVELEADIAETQMELDLFERKYEYNLGPLQKRLQALKAEYDEKKRLAEHRAQWKNKADPSQIPVDVLEQFRKSWEQSEPAPIAEQEQELDGATKEELKNIYRSLAKRFHPDLVVDPSEKKRRAGIMVAVNEAYASKDLAALMTLMEGEDQIAAEMDKSRDEEVSELRSEILRLKGLLVELERKLLDLVNSSRVKIMLDVSMAANSGRDLFAEMALDLQKEIVRVETELVLYR